MSEIDTLKHWIDIEFTAMHVGMYMLMGLVIDSITGWVVCAVLILISVVYMTKRAKILPKNYLKVKE